jgi:hypothetical protein
MCSVPTVFLLYFEKLHSLQPWEGKDWAFCENAKAVKLMQPFLFDIANLARHMFILFG